MFETAGVALATFFATIGPLDISAFFAALTVGLSPRARLVMAARGTLIATIILLSFALFGKVLLDALGISLAALRTAGGILLLLIGIEMVFARTSGATSTTEEEAREAETRRDISVFPLATPLIAGPGAISASILLMVHAEGDTSRQLIVCLSLLAVLLFTFVCLLAAGQLHKLLGRTGAHVIKRVFGVLLAALAVQFIFDGIAESGLL
ncbi:MAG TPA: antibiotic resistance protein MarC [Desulfobulbaceae bacterium]|nr:antibiotic resistance protein MarC [Desulfobulbaceae bacterium]